MKFDPKDPKNWIKTSDKYGYYKVPGKEIVGYASVDFAMNLVFQCISLFISFYYTDIVGLRPAHVAILFLLSRFWDGVNDPLMAIIVERVSPKKGKYTPYIAWGAIPFGIFAIMTYGVPMSFSYSGKMIWAAVTYNLLNMMYTFIVQPYLAGLTLMTNDQDERTRVQSWHMTGSQCGGVVCAIMLPELSAFLSKYMSLAQGYLVATIIMSILMVACLLWGGNQIVERIPPQPIDPNNKASLKDIVHLYRMGPIVLMFLLFLSVYTMSQVQSTMGPYYIKYYAGREDMVSWFSMIMMLFSVIGVPCVPFFAKRIKKKGTVMLGLAIAAVGCIALYFMPAEAIIGMLACRAITGYGYGILMGICWTVLLDPVVYVDFTTGRSISMVVTTITNGFGVKGAMIIGGSVTTAVLDASGYVANEVQSAHTIAVIRNLTTVLPFAVVVVCMILYGLFYHLNEEKVSDMQHAIALRDGVISQ